MKTLIKRVVRNEYVFWVSFLALNILGCLFILKMTPQSKNPMEILQTAVTYPDIMLPYMFVIVILQIAIAVCVARIYDRPVWLREACVKLVRNEKAFLLVFFILSLVTYVVLNDMSLFSTTYVRSFIRLSFDSQIDLLPLLNFILLLQIIIAGLIARLCVRPPWMEPKEKEGETLDGD